MDMTYDDTSLAPSHPTLLPRTNNTGLALGHPQHTSLGYQPVQSVNENSYNDWSHSRDSRGVDDFFSEDKINMRSHELLENEDLQHLLRVFSMGGGAASNMQEDGYGFPSYMPSPFPSYNYDDDRSLSSGKAVDAGLKIKAVMRWGSFIRKKAAERRAQLIELEED